MEFQPHLVVFHSTYFWSVTFTGVVYFVFYGCGEEAISHYRRLVGFALRPFGIQYPKPMTLKAVRRTWLDVLLRRPGKPRKLVSSVQSGKSWGSPTGPSTSIAAKQDRASSGAATSTVFRYNASTGETFNSDLHGCDSLGFSETRAHDAIQTCSRPVSPTIEGTVDTEPANEKSGDIADEKKDPEPETLSRAEPIGEDEDVDLEAQELAEEAAWRGRESIRLELHPELTEEVTF